MGYNTGYDEGYDEGYDIGYGLGYTDGNISASLILDKIIIFDGLTNQSFNYKVILRLINKGGSNATDVNITDTDSLFSPYYIGNVSPGEIVLRDYSISFVRNSSTYDIQTNIAQSVGVDSLSSNLISANSSSLILTIQNQDVGQKLTLIKNVYSNTENLTHVNYTVTTQVVNSGGINLNGVIVQDNDLGYVGEKALNIDLDKGEDYSFSSSILITKNANNAFYDFSTSTAVVNSVSYSSNLIRILIPGFGGPADTIVDAPSYVNKSTNFNTLITITNQNPDIGQNFLLSYWITSFSENTNYSSGSRTIYVGALQSNNTVVTFPAPSGTGKYKFKAVTTYIGGPDLAEDSFEVVEFSTQQEEDDKQSCSYIWECGLWSACSSDGKQTRTCINKGTCKGNVGKPLEEINCSETSFDMKVKLSNLNISENRSLKFNIVLTPKKISEIKEVQAIYIILDSNENEMFNFSKSYFIEGFFNYGEILDNLELTPGEYTLKVYAMYNGEKKSEDIQKFAIMELKPGELPGKFYLKLDNSAYIFNSLIVIGVIILIIILMVVFVKIKFRKTNEINELIKEGRNYVYKRDLEEALDIYPVLKNLYKSKYKGNSNVYKKIISYREFLLANFKDDGNSNLKKRL